MNVLDLFSGIGGFSLGLERAGMRTVAFCECEPYPRAVLEQRWPGIPIYQDVRELSAARLAADGISTDAICGGFPCQDISVAGKGVGIEGERSGLWREFARLIGELRPRYAIVENTSALLGRGLGVVLGDLSEIGYDAEWYCIPASYVGAPHGRDRAWIVAYPGGERRQQITGRALGNEGAHEGRAAEGHHEPSGGGEVVGHAYQPRLQGLRRLLERARERSPWADGEIVVGHDGSARLVKPGIPPLAHGVPRRMERIKSSGNAVVPLIPEIIGEEILSYERQRLHSY